MELSKPGRGEVGAGRLPEMGAERMGSEWSVCCVPLLTVSTRASKKVYKNPKVFDVVGFFFIESGKRILLASLMKGKSL